MDEEVRNWIRKKKKEELEGMKEQAVSESSSQLPTAQTEPTEEKTSEPIEPEPQPIEQKTAAEVTQSTAPQKSPEATVPLDNEPEETPKEEQHPPPQADSNTMKTEYPSKSPLLTKKSKILLILITIFISVLVFVYFYLIPKILK